MTLIRCYTLYASKFEKFSSGQIMPQLPYSFHKLARLCSKSSKAGFSSMLNKNSQKYKLDFEGAEELEIKLLTLMLLNLSAGGDSRVPVSYTHLTLPTKA